MKLTNLGEPRAAPLPRNPETRAGDYVYLPPEVLRGAQYRARADVYGLGEFVVPTCEVLTG